MKIAILSQSRKCYSTRRLVEAARQRGHYARVLDTSRFTILLESDAPSLLYRGKPMERFDAVIPRIGASITFFGTAVVRQFEHMGIFCLNCAESIVDARDKLRSMQLISRHKIDIPTTAMVRSNKDILPAIRSVGGSPVVIKLIQGTQGIGVILAESDSAAEATIQTLRSARQNVLIQKFVRESKGRDVRAFVIGDRVVAAMRRVAQDHEFRSNVHRGGKAQPVMLDDQYTATALRAAHVVGLHVAGVDLLEGSDGPKVTEVNCSPGLQGIETTTSQDVAGAIIEYLEAQIEMPVETPDNATEDYDLAEIIVSPESGLIGEIVGGPKIEGRGLTVLRLAHESDIIERPDKSRLLASGDRLLCFGRAKELLSIRNANASNNADAGNGHSLARPKPPSQFGRVDEVS